MEARIYTNDELSIEAYHADTTAVSKSGLDCFKKSPLHFWHKYRNPDRPKDNETPAKLIGKAFHSLIGEPKKFYDEFCQQPEGIDRRTKAGKEAWEIFCSENPGKNFLSTDQWDQVHRMRDSVMALPASKVIFGSGGRSEHSFYWMHPTLKVLCKCRPDFISASGIIVDYKTTDDASPDGFPYSVNKFRYHVSDAMTLDGVWAHEAAAGPFIILAIEKEAPFASAFYELDADSRSLGRLEYSRNLELYAKCQSEDKWPSYPATIQPLSLPAWKRKELR